MTARRSSPKDRQPVRRIRCAIYTRKSHEEGLDQSFNSLDAQREAAESYIKSQRADGWTALETRYDDGGYSGATMDRPALRRLLQDVEAGLVDMVVIYRVDRLSRSILDFAKIVEVLEEHGASFVSVKEQMNTSTPTGRLQLHMIVSFAEFERAVIAERIRDKVHATKRKGKYCGGPAVLGYDVDREAKRLVVNADEAQLVRRIFRRFAALQSSTTLAGELNAAGFTTKTWTTKKGVTRQGGPWDKARIYTLLHNRTYLGQVEHKGNVYDGEHSAIVSQSDWDAVHAVLEKNRRARAATTRAKTPALLKGLIRCGHCDASMGPTFSSKRGRRYAYYLCSKASKRGYRTCPVRSVAAGAIEDAVVGQLRACFRTPEIIAATFREAKARESEEIERLERERKRLQKEVTAATTNGTNGTTGTADAPDDAAERLQDVTRDLRALRTHPVTERSVQDALDRLEPVWAELFPAERARIVGLLVKRVDVYEDGLELRLRADGLRSLVTELMPEPVPDVPEAQAAGAQAR